MVVLLLSSKHQTKLIENIEVSSSEKKTEMSTAVNPVPLD